MVTHTTVGATSGKEIWQLIQKVLIKKTEIQNGNPIWKRIVKDIAEYGGAYL
jgi:hypothetical protein